MAHTYKVGDTVVPTIGPHKGHPHTVIHVHSTGEVNIKPKGLHRSQNRYRMGAATAQPQHLNPHTVAESASCPDCGCDPCKCKVKLTEELTPAHKGSHQYSGKIGGKTYVVPHATYSSFEPDYKKPLSHSTVTSREHVAKHNKNMSPKEIDTIHQHIQQVHKEGVEEGYTIMKGKESFMKKKPLDVKYGSRWQVMSHGKTMERPTKEEVELDESEPQTHKVMVTVSDPNHPMVHKRKELIAKRVAVRSHTKEGAVEKAKKFYRNGGYKVHDAEHHSIMPSSTMKTEETQLDEKFINGRQYASHGLMHPEHAGLPIHQKTGREIDFYASGTGDKISGKVTKNDGKHVHIQAHKTQGGKLHTFKVTPHLPKAQNEEVELEEAMDSFGYPSHSYDHVMKKLKSGEWETSYDLKKGKHTTITDKKTGKQRMIHVKEDVALDEASLKDACWKGYEAIGMKEKGGKKVPNCVPVKNEEVDLEEAEIQPPMPRLKTDRHMFSIPEKEREAAKQRLLAKTAEKRKKLGTIKEQTPSGGFGGPESAGVTSGGDVSTKTIAGSDTAPKSTRKQEILKDVMKSAKEKQKQKIGGKSEFEKDPEYHPLVITQQ